MAYARRVYAHKTFLFLYICVYVCVYSAHSIYRCHFSPHNSWNIPRARYGRLSWVWSVAEVLPSKLLYCMQYRLILYRDRSIVWIYVYIYMQVCAAFVYLFSSLSSTSSTSMFIPIVYNRRFSYIHCFVHNAMSHKCVCMYIENKSLSMAFLYFAC